MSAHSAVELFSRGGGLAVGLRRAGVSPFAAVELDDYAAATFAANHPDVRLFRKDVRDVSGRQLLDASPNGAIDVLAACPPCQGFSTLTAKYKRDDGRNKLVAEVGRIASETLPLAIMMENVPGLAGRGGPILKELLGELHSLGYVTNVRVLQVADFGIPQTRRRLVMLAGLGFSIDMPRRTHSRAGTGDTTRWRTLRETIAERGEAFRIDRAAELGGFDVVNWHVVRRLGDANLERLRNAEPGKSRKHLPREVRPNCHRDNDTGFRNTYGRMDWDRPSSTITAGCLSPSKGRFGHPDELRTISFREAALLQTFPPEYRFVGDSIDRACAVLGNALPCLFAQRIAEQVLATLKRAVPWLPDDLLAKRRSLADGTANQR